MNKIYQFLFLISVLNFLLSSIQSQTKSFHTEENIKSKNGIPDYSSCLTNYTSNDKFSPSELRSDFEIFRRALENEHGGIYRHTSKQEMNHVFDSVQNLLNDSLYITSLYNFLTLCVARMNCEHTNVYLPIDLNNDMEKMTGFPIFIFKNKNGTYVEYNYSKNKSIIEGSQIKMINNKPIEEINKIIFQHLSSDGDITTSKDRKLSGINFPIYYKLFISDTSIFKVNFVTPDGTTHTIDVYADTLKKINTQCLLNYKKRMAEDIKFEIIKLSDSLNIVYLKLNRFRLNKKHTQIIDSIFNYISDNKIQNLIIDIRDNAGGAGSNYLYSYLTEEDFVFVDSAFVRIRKFKYAKKYSRSSKFISLINKISWLLTKKITNDRYLVKKNLITKQLGADEMGIQHPSPINNYTGKIYLLINGLTLSEASIFSSIIHYNKRAVIIGEESGGSYYGPTSSIVPKIELPLTKIQFTIPLVEINTPVSGIDYGKGTIPHYFIEEDINNRIKNIDTILNFTIELIRN